MTTLSYAGNGQRFNSNSGGTGDGQPRGIEFNDDGTKMFVVGNAADEINQYSLSTGFNVKTASFAKKIDINEIRKIINFSGEYKSENLVNECLCGNLIQLKKILSEMYFNNVNQIFILRILSNKIQRLLNMKIDEKKHQSLDILLNSVKPPIFWKEKTMVKRQLVIWNEKKLKKIIDDINNIELQCKKNPQISKIIFFNFVADLCKKASSYA